MSTNFIKIISVLFIATTMFTSCESITDEQVLPSENAIKTSESARKQNESHTWTPKGQVKMYFKYSKTEWKIATVSGAKIKLLNLIGNKVDGTEIMTTGSDGKFEHPYSIDFKARVRFEVDSKVPNVKLYKSDTNGTQEVNFIYDPRNKKWDRF